MKKWGIVRPKNPIDETDEVKKYIGKIVDDNNIVPSLDSGWVIVTENHDDKWGYPVGTLLPEDCLIELKPCSCDSFSIWNYGCKCGAFYAEKNFREKCRTKK